MFLLLFCVLFPAVCCLSFLFLNRISDRRGRMAVLLSLQGIETLAAFWLVFSDEKATGNLVLTDQIQIGFSSDPLAKFFVFLIALGWLLVSIYATVYMKHEEEENRFFLFMLLSEAAMMGAASALMAKSRKAWAAALSSVPSLVTITKGRWMA